MCLHPNFLARPHCSVRRKLTASQDTSVLPLASHELWNDDAFVEAAIDTWTFFVGIVMGFSWDFVEFMALYGNSMGL